MAFNYQFYSPREIKPLGWLRRQLELQADGLSGNLDKIWPDVSDSAWIGGRHEGWERVPYWLDGIIPLAYLLDSPELKEKADRYINRILALQKKSGWICPRKNIPLCKYDVWAVFLLARVLVSYEACTHDPRIPEAVLKIMNNLRVLMSRGTVRLVRWGSYRWFECFITLNRLKEWYPDEKWIDGFAGMIREQGVDYNEIMCKWERPLNKWSYDTHIVNIVMMLKYEAVSCGLLGEEYTNRAEELWQYLTCFNGTPAGILTGDECLSGISPIHGSELCSAVELMRSFEWLYAYSGDVKWAERLEKVAFNALPAAISDDMWSHQYDQMSNQIDCTPFPGKSVFRTNNNEAHIFGLEPHFGCCTANFGQGWPRLAESVFMRANDGVAVAVPIPARLSTEWNGTPVQIELETDYPFRNSFTYRVTADGDTDMKLHMRIPSFAGELTVNGKPEKKKKSLVFGGFKKGETVITVAWSATPELCVSNSGLHYAEYGSLVFAFPVEGEKKAVEYTRNGVERKYPYCDYHISGKGDWNRAFTSDRLTVEELEPDNIPFSSEHPALRLRAMMCHIDWGFEDGYDTVCARLPEHRTPLDTPGEVSLYPYGCAKLRMTELPLIHIKSQSPEG